MEDLSHVLVWAKANTAKEEEDGAGSAGNALSDSNNEGSQALAARVELIELPRLKLRLKPVVSRNGATVKLELLDHAGWFVSDRFSSKATATAAGGEATTSSTAAAASSLPSTAMALEDEEEKKESDGSSASMGSASLRWLPSLLHGLGEALVVESEGEGLQLLVPNHDLHRPEVR
jgi:hypothetical protein